MRAHEGCFFAVRHPLGLKTDIKTATGAQHLTLRSASNPKHPTSQEMMSLLSILMPCEEVKINVTSFFFSVEILSTKGDFPFRMCQRSLKQKQVKSPQNLWHKKRCGGMAG